MLKQYLRYYSLLIVNRGYLKINSISDRSYQIQIVYNFISPIKTPKKQISFLFWTFFFNISEDFQATQTYIVKCRTSITGAPIKMDTRKVQCGRIFYHPYCIVFCKFCFHLQIFVVFPSSIYPYVSIQLGQTKTSLGQTQQTCPLPNPLPCLQTRPILSSSTWGC